MPTITKIHATIEITAKIEVRIGLNKSAKNPERGVACKIPRKPNIKIALKIPR